MDCKFCNRENTKYSCILCGNRVCSVRAVPVEESQEGCDEQNYQIGKCLKVACEESKDKIKEKVVVTQSIKRKGKIFRSFLGNMVCLDSSKKPFKFKSICDSSTVLSCIFVIFQ